MKHLRYATQVLLLVGSLAGPAWAHHILGVPHYAYKDNFPQAPVLEYPAQTGPYDVLLSVYPGRPIPGEAASVVFYITERATGTPYLTPVSLRVATQAAFGRSREIYPATEHEHTLNQFKYAITFPDDGEYVLELTMAVEGATDVIPFRIVVGDPRAPGLVIGGIGGALLFFAIVVRALKRKQARRRAAAAPAPQVQAV